MPVSSGQLEFVASIPFAATLMIDSTRDITVLNDVVIPFFIGVANFSGSVGSGVLAKACMRMSSKQGSGTVTLSCNPPQPGCDIAVFVSDATVTTVCAMLELSSVTGTMVFSASSGSYSAASPVASWNLSLALTPIQFSHVVSAWSPPAGGGSGSWASDLSVTEGEYSGLNGFFHSLGDLGKSILSLPGGGIIYTLVWVVIYGLIAMVVVYCCILLGRSMMKSHKKKADVPLPVTYVSEEAIVVQDGLRRRVVRDRL